VTGDAVAACSECLEDCRVRRPRPTEETLSLLLRSRLRPVDEHARGPTVKLDPDAPFRHALDERVRARLEPHVLLAVDDRRCPVPENRLRIRGIGRELADEIRYRAGVLVARGPQAHP